MLVVSGSLSVVKKETTDSFFNWTQIRPLNSIKSTESEMKSRFCGASPCLHGGQVNTDSHR
jgi:hypothetical protein